jgi:hypothetical protein
MYKSRISSHAAAGSDIFTHSAAIRAGKTATKVHEKLDPSIKNKAGKLIRESFDSPAQPESVPVFVLFDVTGSMNTVPEKFIKKLGTLMNLLVKKGYLKNPHVLFGAIGDATCDEVPLQIGQFESGNEMDEVLSLIYPEGGGGGNVQESYELGMYYMARHTEIDSFKKRGKKGYAFLLGDEKPYPRVKKNEVKSVIGDTIQADIPTQDIIAELRERYEVFWIMPGGTSYFNNPAINDHLKKLFGQNFYKMEDPESICNLISTIIGICEGFDVNEIETDLKDAGADAKDIKNTLAVVKTFADTRTTKKTAGKKGKLVIAGDDAVTRL